MLAGNAVRFCRSSPPRRRAESDRPSGASTGRPSQPNDEDDDALRAAHGILLAAVLGAVCWAGLAAFLWLVLGR